MSDNIFLIYQLNKSSESRNFRFEPIERLRALSLAVERDRYNHIYTGVLEPGMALDDIFGRFNISRPEDFAGHALSVSDVVALQQNGMVSAYYVDNFGFKDVPEFMDAPYRYYSTQRPVDIGTFPKTDNGPVRIFNFDKREYVENATFRAWGYLVYDAPLPQSQLDDYELRAASDNPDCVRLSPYQLEAQTQIVGKWENAKRIPDTKRLTWYHNDFGIFVRNAPVTWERITEQYGQILEDKARNAENRAAKKPIAEQLKENAEQAARDNAKRETPPAGGDNREDR